MPAISQFDLSSFYFIFTEPGAAGLSGPHPPPLLRMAASRRGGRGDTAGRGAHNTKGVRKAAAHLHERVESAVEDGSDVAGLVPRPQVLDQTVRVQHVVPYLAPPLRLPPHRRPRAASEQGRSVTAR